MTWFAACLEGLFVKWLAVYNLNNEASSRRRSLNYWHVNGYIPELKRHHWAFIQKQNKNKNNKTYGQRDYNHLSNSEFDDFFLCF